MPCTGPALEKHRAKDCHKEAVLEMDALVKVMTGHQATQHLCPVE